MHEFLEPRHLGQSKSSADGSLEVITVGYATCDDSTRVLYEESCARMTAQHLVMYKLSSKNEILWERHIPSPDSLSFLGTLVPRSWDKLPDGSQVIIGNVKGAKYKLWFLRLDEFGCDRSIDCTNWGGTFLYPEVVNELNELELFPNPVKGNELRVRSLLPSDHEVRVYDMMGRERYTGQFQGITLYLPLNMESGMYYLRLDSEGSIYGSKFQLVR